MGLLDALVPYSDGGGLLDFLKRNAMSQSFPSGLPSDQAQYDAPQMPAAYAPGQVQAAPLAPPMQAPQMAPQGMPQPQMSSAAPGPGPAMPAPAPVQAPQMPAGGNAWSNFFNRGADALSSLSQGGSLLGAVRGQYDDPLSQQTRISNQTARALIAKGVPQDVAIAAVQPGNTELLKTLIDRSFGAPKPPTVIGEGHIWNPQTNKVEQAYEPSDKIPSGFRKTDTGMEPTPGGPADPAYMRLVEAQKKDPNAVHVLGKGGELYKVDEKGVPTVVHKNDEGADASLDDPTATMMAKQYLAGDRSVMQNLGRGAQGSANIVKLRGAIKAEADKQGLDGEGIAQRMIDYVGDTSRERTAATQEGRMAPAGIEAHGAIQLGRIASDAVPRGNWVPINKAIQAYQEGTSDPQLRAFGSANTTIINTYARAINPNGVGTVADKEHARQMLSTADGPAAYKAVLDQLEKEIEMAHQSPSQARAGFRQEREGRLSGNPVSPTLPNLTGTPTQKSAPTPPKPGEEQGGYRFKGGNPADKSNWEKVS